MKYVSSIDANDVANVPVLYIVLFIILCLPIKYMLCCNIYCHVSFVVQAIRPRAPLIKFPDRLGEAKPNGWFIYFFGVQLS